MRINFTHKIIKIALAVAICVGSAVQPAKAQQEAIKTNLLYGGATLTPNLGLEFGLSRKLSLDLSVGYNPWNLKGTKDSNEKLVHLMTQAELRYWTCQKFDGHFFGVHGLYSQYNIGQKKLDFIFGSDSKDYRFQGTAIGGGFSYGYQWILGKRWSLEATIGIGAAYLSYDKYECKTCGNLVGTENKFYFGPTRVGINIVYIIN